MPWSHNVKTFYNINIDMTVIAVRVNGSGIVFVNLQIVRRQRYLGHHGLPKSSVFELSAHEIFCQMFFASPLH